MIKKITLKDFDIVKDLFKSVTADMSSAGIDQWDDKYPSYDILTEDITSGSAFGYFIENKPEAYIVLNEKYDREYDEVEWQYDHGNSLIIHRLAVHPDFQNRGIAKSMMNFAEIFASENKYSAIRFDAFEKNHKSVNFYEKLGYSIPGTVRFRKGIFCCFEKLLKPSVL